MTDKQLEHDVRESLDTAPSLDATGVRASVHHGVVTLRGEVPSYAEKLNVQRAVLCVEGVRAVANDILVRLPGLAERTDGELVEAALAALAQAAMVPRDRVRVGVADGWVTLTGTLDHYLQSAAAERCVRHLAGVRGISNDLRLKAPPTVLEARRAKAGLAGIRPPDDGDEALPLVP